MFETQKQHFGREDKNYDPLGASAVILDDTLKTMYVMMPGNSHLAHGTPSTGCSFQVGAEVCLSKPCACTFPLKSVALQVVTACVGLTLLPADSGQEDHLEAAMQTSGRILLPRQGRQRSASITGLFVLLQAQPLQRPCMHHSQRLNLGNGEIQSEYGMSGGI